MSHSSGRLAKAPVVYALCQIRFSPVLKMGEFVADIQEQLRSRFEGFQEENETGIEVPTKGQPVVQVERRWRFDRADRRAGFILHNSSMVFHTTDYADFDVFVPDILYGFNIVSKMAKIPHVQRIGLRYIDLIEADEKVAAQDFLHPQLRGFSSELPDVKEDISQYVLNCSTDAGRMIFRATRGTHAVPVPPDLLPLVLKVIRTPDPKKISIFLDTDHFVDRQDNPIAVSEVENTIRALKLPISAVFKKAVTKEALAAWK